MIILSAASCDRPMWEIQRRSYYKTVMHQLKQLLSRPSSINNGSW